MRARARLTTAIVTATAAMVSGQPMSSRAAASSPGRSMTYSVPWTAAREPKTSAQNTEAPAKTRRSRGSVRQALPIPSTAA
jgi:hypothetical protein